MSAKNLPIIGVMGSGKESFADYAGPLGRLIAQAGCHLLTGGGQGVMACVSEAFVRTKPRKGVCIGIVPSVAHGTAFCAKPGYPNPFAELVINTPLGTFEETSPRRITRNHVSIMSCDAVIILPGTRGTRHQTDLALRFKKPVLGYGPRHRFKGFDDVRTTDRLSAVREFLCEFEP